jgi:hypothetical protein
MAVQARNLGPGGRRRRLILGVVMLAVAVAGAVLLLLAGADRGLRALLFLPFWVGALGMLQARAHT